jgi:predicted amidophosphoribosyltransferase
MILGFTKFDTEDGKNVQRQLPPVSMCSTCGRGRVEWECPRCGLQLCEKHSRCPECEAEIADEKW